MALQHRGEDGAGIVVASGDGGLKGVKGKGLVSEVFSDSGSTLDDMVPNSALAVAHVRYGTVEGVDSFLSSQPLLPGDGSFALGHNGHIANMEEVAERYELPPDSQASDSQRLTSVLAAVSATHESLDMALDEVLPQLEGAFCLVITDGMRMIGVRDTHGFRPLSLGTRLDGGYVLASETPAFKSVGAEFNRDIAPGEIVTFGIDGRSSSRQIDRPANPKLCAFELVYLARQESEVDGRNVYLARERLGAQLAREVQAIDADMVVGVPDSGLPAAKGYARQAGLPDEMGILRNSYATRTFLQDSTGSREEGVRLKLHPNTPVIEGKRLVVVDDSIVRGTTMRSLVGLLREAGAAEVHLRIPCPPYRWSCFYGMDTGNREDLLANRMNEDEMREYLGVDSLVFLSIEGFQQAIGAKVGSLCLACLDGEYPTLVPDVEVAIS